MDKIAFEDIYIKFKKTDLVKIHSNLVWELTAPHAHRSAEMNLRSTTTNGFNFRMIISLIESWGLSLTWLDCEFKVSHWHVIKGID